jgi:polyisoprenyl-phosphate glycosyltransferase
MAAPAQPRLWIVSPLYLDVEAYLLLRQELLAVAKELPLRSVELVVVDDSAGSDPQVQTLAGHGVRVVVPPFNVGHQRAIVFGLRSLEDRIAEDDLVVTMDSDGEDRPGDLPSLLAPLLKEPHARRHIVLARRTQRHVSAAFKAMYFFFKLFFHSLTGLVIRTGNYAAFRGWTVKHVIPHPHFELCYSSSLISLNLDATYVPCPRGRRYAGQSRMGYLKLIRHGLAMLMPFLDRIAVRALVTFSATLALGVALWVVLLLLSSAGLMAAPGWAVSGAVTVSIVSFVALGNLVVLFAIYVQSQGAALSRIDRREAASGPEPAATTATPDRPRG